MEKLNCAFLVALAGQLTGWCLFQFQIPFPSSEHPGQLNEVKELLQLGCGFLPPPSYAPPPPPLFQCKESTQVMAFLSKPELLYKGLEPTSELKGSINYHYMENHTGSNL